MEEHQNFEMIAGNSKTVRISVTKEDGSKLALTGCSIKWMMSNGSQTVTKTTPGTITVTDAVNGLFELKLLPVDTDTLRGEFYHECEITDASGDVSTVLTGTIQIQRGLF